MRRSTCRREYTEESLCTSPSAQIRAEQELQTRACARQCARSYYYDNQHEEQQRHCHLTELLDTAGYTTEYDYHCQEQVTCHPCNGVSGVGQQSAELCARIGSVQNTLTEES